MNTEFIQEATTMDAIKLFTLEENILVKFSDSSSRQTSRTIWSRC